MRLLKSKVQSPKSKAKSVFFVLLILTVMLSGCNKPRQNQASNIPDDAIGIVNDRKLSLKLYEWKLKSGCEALGINPATGAGNRDFEELREGIVSNLIDSALIEEEVPRRNHGKTITDEGLQEIEKEEIKKFGSETDYENYLKKYGLTREDYKESLKSVYAENRLVEEFAIFTKITDKEVEDYYKEHGSEMNPPDESGKKLTLEQAKPEIIKTLQIGRAKQKLSDWLKEARKKAKVQLKDGYYFGKLKEEFPFNRVVRVE